MRAFASAYPVLAAASLLAACANLPNALETLTLETNRPVPGSSTEHYTRIARGARSCWFGENGPLAADYAYQAKAEPASRGGKAEIVIRAREAAGKKPKGLRVFTVTIKPKGDNAEIKTVNHKLPEELGGELESDVKRWTAGAVGCRDIARGADWTPKDRHQSGKPPPLPKKNKKKKR